MRIVFLGTPDFAVASLKALVDEGFQVVACVTAPDKPAGRGMLMQQSPVKQFALAHAIPVLQPEKLKDVNFLQQLASFRADVQVVVAFRMLPEQVWNMPPMGTINVHASLLPSYRGAAPINWAIIRGETVTGVTTFKLQHAIDTGNILLQSKVPITYTDNAGSMHDKLMNEGALLLIKTLQQIRQGQLQEHVQQTTGNEPHAPKLFTETCSINWNQPVQDLYNFIRGLSPYPAAHTILHHKKIKVYSGRKELAAHNLTPGSIESDQSSFLKFAGVDGFIHITELQLEGKKRMQITDFLRGYRFPST